MTRDRAYHPTLGGAIFDGGEGKFSRVDLKVVRSNTLFVGRRYPEVREEIRGAASGRIGVA